VGKTLYIFFFIFTLVIQDKDLTLIVLVQKWQSKLYLGYELKLRVGRVNSRNIGTFFGPFLDMLVVVIFAN